MITAILIFLIVSSIYILMILPRLVNRADMDGLLDEYAHRGLHGVDLPENSMGAFKAAMDKGVGIELDIQLSSDGIPMVFHDDSLKRICGIDAKVSDYTADELKKIRLLDSEYTIPTFEEVLLEVDGRVPLLVEFKPGNWELCYKGCDLLDEYKGRFCVESFDSILLGKIKKHRPKFARGQLVGNMFRSPKPKNLVLKFLLTFMMLNFISRPDFIAVDKALKHNLSIGICRRIVKIPVLVWTIKNEDEYEKSKREGLVPIFDNYN